MIFIYTIVKKKHKMVQGLSPAKMKFLARIANSSVIQVGFEVRVERRLRVLSYCFGLHSFQNTIILSRPTLHPLRMEVNGKA